MRYLLDMGINEVGNLAAPPGSQAWAIAVRFEIQSLLERNKNIVKSLQAYLLQMEHYAGYNQLTDENGEPFSCFVDFCSGTAILLEGRRIVLIPSEAIDDGELEIPQEWVDILSWAADYYLAVQVKPDGEWIRIWGYTTHEELKSLAHYDSVDRTYCIDARHLTKDLNAFSLSYQFCQGEEMKAAIDEWH